MTKLETYEQILGNMETHEYIRGRNVSNVYGMESWHPIINQSIDFVFVVYSKLTQNSSRYPSSEFQSGYRSPIWFPSTYYTCGFVLRLCFVIPFYLHHILITVGYIPRIPLTLVIHPIDQWYVQILCWCCSHSA